VKVFCNAFADLIEETNRTRRGPVYVDCANGVGAGKLPRLLEQLTAVLNCHVFNKNVQSEQDLNNECGAEHVQKTRQPPKNIPEGVPPNTLFASFDGDADRVVFYYFKADKSFKLLDGDKIASLLAKFIQTQVKIIGIKASIGCVQTAYANGGSTRYLKTTLGVDTPLVKTGVKHLHHKALEYDVGVYFEANGHGTVLFHESFIRKLKSAETSEESFRAKKRLLALARVLNQTVGDAICDFLAVEGVLRVLGMGIDDWDALYEDLPSRQPKVKVRDRTLIETTGDESRCLRPEKLQTKIDELVKQFEPSARAFVRPSGTEDVVRVYAEAKTEESALKLAKAVCEAVYDIVGGVDASPPVVN